MEEHAMLNFNKSIVCYKHSIPPGCFSHYCSHIQEGGWILQDITKVCEPMHRHKMLKLNKVWHLTCTFY